MGNWESPPSKTPHCHWFTVTAGYWTCCLLLILQYSSSLQFILEGMGLCQEHDEEQAGSKLRQCWHCCFVWTWVFCMVLWGPDCGQRIYIHRLLCLIGTAPRPYHNKRFIVEIGIFRSIRPLIEFYTIFFIVLILMFRIDNSIRCGEHNNVWHWFIFMLLQGYFIWNHE